ncbi:hypothetical protein [Acidithiobacillus ferridurans]|uniref:Uncharacterized protein n=1 Tax=Acidithiobacillus ferridurans TaxID=1232575 RepID=A0A8X8G7V8_ACIFI|nr:hypothetical protein [Acidithiobacillus ferridurans]MBU2714600.1 hypothetical protein [Acidithiobacillus ferridurans]MBU2723881.1 hypothetical protein [Acidithiobacillus ferridurans]MBU2726323.1 hypothetical protein [Acidithiobacillus ferridurans]
MADLISIPLIDDRKLGVRLEVDTSIAGKMLESLDRVLIADHTPDGARMSFSGGGLRVSIEMDLAVTDKLRDTIEHALISDIPLPEMLQIGDGFQTALASMPDESPAKTQPCSNPPRKIGGEGWRKFVDFVSWRWM